MEEEIYLHAIETTNNEFNEKNTLIKLNKILKKGALLSLRKQRKMTNGNFCGPDYISLCDYEKRFEVQKEDKLYNSYNGFILNSLSIVFLKKDVNAIRPIILDNICPNNKEGFKRMYTLGNSKENRYSDLPDEVQVKDSLSLDKMIAITLPKKKIISNERNSLDDTIDMIKHILIMYGYDVPIYDIETFERLDIKQAKLIRK